MSPPISICVTVKNRSRIYTEQGTLKLFPNCVNSIETHFPKAEILAADWNSTDWPLSQWFHHTIIPMPDPFVKADGLEKCAEQAQSDILFLMDCDVFFTSPEVFERGINIAQQGKAYFPICWSYSNPEHTEGWWRITAFGSVILPKSLFLAHKWRRQTTWGEDDFDFYKRLQPLTVRDSTHIFHQWHPDLW